MVNYSAYNVSSPATAGHWLTDLAAALGSAYQHNSSGSCKSWLIICQSDPTSQQDFVALNLNLFSSFDAKSS